MLENFTNIVHFEILSEIVSAKWICALKNAVITKNSKMQISDMIFDPFQSMFKRVPLAVVVLDEIHT